ncbi:MAG: UDP-N-acetyl-D-glucosamine dehydrogenase [Candidatus Zixiibacteriota bacterium]|nr:MAG: UDP-N-acetyl-D-glucosamine dehydrogenase [candidate division Zixibacteria bacterium]
MGQKTNRSAGAYKTLIKKLQDHSAKSAVVGLGYVGLPLSMELAHGGFRVTGFDISESKIKLLNSGRSDIDDVTHDTVQRAVSSGRFKATTDFKQISNMDTVSICVPTPLSKTKDPDVSFILSAVNNVKAYLKRGALVVLESTTYPGTTEDLILPLLQEGGRKVGKDFFLAFSPERVDPGNPRYNTKNTPRVVGGTTAECTKAAKIFYEQTMPNIHTVSSTRAAEMVKLLENTFRSVNIGLVNEVALMCDRLNLDVWEIIDAAATKPFGFMPFYPGPGLGGHCIPIDPHYLSWKLKSLNYYARFIELAGDINSSMPEWVVQRIVSMLNERFAKALNNTHILVLGVSYKPDIKDVRESPSLDVITLLEKMGAKVVYNDPFVQEIALNNANRKSVRLTAALLKKTDLTVILTHHSTYNYQWIVDHSKAVFDTRNATRSVRKNRDKIELL